MGVGGEPGVSGGLRGVRLGVLRGPRRVSPVVSRGPRRVPSGVPRQVPGRGLGRPLVGLAAGLTVPPPVLGPSPGAAEPGPRPARWSGRRVGRWACRARGGRSRGGEIRCRGAWGACDARGRGDQVRQPCVRRPCRGAGGARRRALPGRHRRRAAGAAARRGGRRRQDAAGGGVRRRRPRPGCRRRPGRLRGDRRRRAPVRPVLHRAARPAPGTRRHPGRHPARRRRPQVRRHRPRPRHHRRRRPAARRGPHRLRHPRPHAAEHPPLALVTLGLAVAEGRLADARAGLLHVLDAGFPPGTSATPARTCWRPPEAEADARHLPAAEEGRDEILRRLRTAAKSLTTGAPVWVAHDKWVRAELHRAEGHDTPGPWARPSPPSRPWNAPTTGPAPPPVRRGTPRHRRRTRPRPRPGTAAPGPRRRRPPRRPPARRRRHPARPARPAPPRPHRRAAHRPATASVSPAGNAMCCAWSPTAAPTASSRGLPETRSANSCQLGPRQRAGPRRLPREAPPAATRSPPRTPGLSPGAPAAPAAEAATAAGRVRTHLGGARASERSSGRRRRHGEARSGRRRGVALHRQLQDAVVPFFGSPRPSVLLVTSHSLFPPAATTVPAGRTRRPGRAGGRPRPGCPSAGPATASRRAAPPSTASPRRRRPRWGGVVGAPLGYRVVEGVVARPALGLGPAVVVTGLIAFSSSQVSWPNSEANSPAWRPGQALHIAVAVGVDGRVRERVARGRLALRGQPKDLAAEGVPVLGQTGLAASPVPTYSIRSGPKAIRPPLCTKPWGMPLKTVSGAPNCCTASPGRTASGRRDCPRRR
ncbi:hypothetical protein SFUMM280S_02453 [Streptomyces fumanus]